MGAEAAQIFRGDRYTFLLAFTHGLTKFQKLGFIFPLISVEWTAYQNFCAYRNWEPEKNPLTGGAECFLSSVRLLEGSIKSGCRRIVIK